MVASVNLGGNLASDLVAVADMDSVAEDVADSEVVKRSASAPVVPGTWFKRSSCQLFF